MKGKLDLAQVEMYIDNESTHYNIYSDKNPEETSLIYDIRRIQQLIKEKEVSKVHLIDTKYQMADPLTKAMKPSSSFNRAVFLGLLVPECRCCCLNPSGINYVSSTGLVDLEVGYGTEHEENKHEDRENWRECNAQPLFSQMTSKI